MSFHVLTVGFRSFKFAVGLSGWGINKALEKYTDWSDTSAYSFFLTRVALNRSFNVTHFKRAIVYRLGKQQQCNQKQADVGDKHSTVIPCIRNGSVCDTDANGQKDQSTQEQQVAPLTAEVCTNR